MATILLDTSVIVDHLNGRRGRPAFLERLIDDGHDLACCPVNITEVYAGLRLGEEVRTKRFIDSLECLTVTPAIAREAGLLRGEWRAKGHTLGLADVIIAAVALAHRAPLLTDNGKHFPEEGLVLWPLPE